MRFFVVRHGETAWNLEGRFQGQIDTDLNAKGIEQAELVAQRLAGHEFQAIITSPLSRAKVTAEKIAELSDFSEFLLDNEFTEISHGDWEGCLADEILAKWPEVLNEWHSKPENVKMPGESGETLHDVQKRTVKAAEEVAKKYTGDVLLASHDAVIKVLLCYWLGAPLSSFWRFQIPNASITVVEVLPGKAPRILLMSDAAHIGNAFDRPEQKGL